MEAADVVEMKTDITEKFSDARKGLEKDEVAMLEGLSLESTVNELMEPEMDIGMHRHVKKTTVDSLIAEGYFENVSDQEVLTIIDATLSCLVAFLTGSEATQTLNTNVLLCEAEKEIPHPVLNALSKLFSHIMPVIQAVIDWAGVSSQEDFSPKDVPPFPLKVLTEEDLLELVRQATPNNESPISQAIRTRLSWLNRFIEFCNRFIPEKEGEEFVPDIKDALGFAKSMTRLSSTFEETTSLGLRKQDEAGVDEGIEKDGLFGWLRVFDPLIDEEAPGPSVRRIPNRLEAMTYLSDFSHKMMLFIPFVPKTIVTIEMILHFLRAMCQKDSCALSRSIFQVCFRPGESGFLGQIRFRSVVLNSIYTHACCPFLRAECSLSKSAECLKLVDKLIAALHAVIDDVIAIFGMNMSRQQKFLLQPIHKIWSTAEAAEDVDQFVKNYRFSPNGSLLLKYGRLRSIARVSERRLFVDHSRPLIAWIRSLVLRLILNLLDVILSLDPLSDFELPSFFWFYGEVALQEMMNNSETDDDLISRQMMCRGIYFACLAMIKRGQIKFPLENSEQVCYEHRLQNLLGLPFVPNFEQYLSLSRKPEHLKKNNADELWKKSAFNFARCREIIKEESCVRGMSAACNRNLTAARLLAVAEDRQVIWEFSDEFDVFPALVISK